MKKISSVLALILAVVLVVMALSASAEEEKVLNIYTWSTYFDDTTLAHF